jgi:transmembrane 9 superfamily protein 3
LYEFLLLVLIMLFFVTGCISVVFSYTLLNSEDYRWPWPVFITSGFSAVYIFLYSIFYFFSVTKYDILNIYRMHGMFQIIWYFVYTFILCFSIFCMLGSIGYISAILFIQKLYSNVKVE